MNNNHPHQNTAQHPPAEMLVAFLDNQAKELELKNKELELQRLNQKNAFEYSHASLRSEAEDRAAQRLFVQKIRRETFVFISVISFAVFGLLGYALSLGKDQIVMEVIRSVIFLLSGGAGGYAIGSKASRKEVDRKE